MRGRDLTDRVPRQEVRADTPRLDQAEQRDLDREECGLRGGRLVDPLTREDDIPQRTVHLPVQLGADRVERRREHRERLVQLSAHPGTLAPLPGEQERRATGGTHPAGDDPGRRLATGQRGQRIAQPARLTVDHRRPVLERRPGRGQREPDVRQVSVRLALQSPQQPRGLPAEGLRRPPRQHQRHRRRCTRRDTALRRRLVDSRCLLQQDVRVRAADAERRHRRATRLAGQRPQARLGQQLDRPHRPVHVRGRLGDVQRLRQHAVPHRHDHLHDPGGACGGLGVAQVRLDRPQPERGVGVPVLAVGREQGLRLDRVAQAGPRAVRLDHVDLSCRQTGVGQGLLDHPLLGRAVRGGQTVARAVLVHGRAAHDRQHRVTVASGIAEPLDEQHADALTPARTVRAVREGLASAVGRQTALAAELHEGARRQHDGHTPGQCQRRLTRAERLAGQVQGHQRGRAGGVDRHRRALQAQRVGHPARGDAARGAGADLALQALDRLGQQHAVLVVHDSDEHAGSAAAQRGRVDAGPLEGLPGGLQQQSLLRVDRHRLTRAYAEERRVERPRAVQEAALTGVRGAGVVRVGVVEVLHVPAAVLREERHRVPPGGHQIPQALGGGDPAREPACHADDRDRLVVVLGARGGRSGRQSSARERAQQLGSEQLGERGRGRVVEDQGGRQSQAGDPVEAVAQLDGGQRVEAELLERPSGVHRGVVRVAEHRRDLRADQLQQRGLALSRGERRQPLGQRRSARLAGRARAPGGAAHRPADQAPQQRRQQTRGALGAQTRQVQLDRDQQRFGRPHGHVEEQQAVLGGQRRDAAARHPLDVGADQGGCHAAVLGPQAPGQRGRRQSGCPAVLGEGVQEAVRRRVVALTSRTEHPGSRGEHHEGGEILLLRQFVQVPGRVHLGTQHGVDPLGGEGRDDAVIQHTGRVHQGSERVLQRVQQPRECGAVGDVAGRDGDLRAQRRQVRDQLVDALGRSTAARDQQQAARAVRGHQVPGEQPAQSARGPGEQHRALGIQLRGDTGIARRQPRQTRHQRHTRTQGELRLTGVDGGGERSP